MAHYLVVWEIDIDADSPEEAAREARAIQLDKESKATVFVLHSDNGTDTIDTSDEEIEKHSLREMRQHREPVALQS